MSTYDSRQQETGGTTEPSINSFRGKDGPDRHAREDALSPMEFERGAQSIYRMDGDYFQLECRFVWFVGGRLGLRSGEIVHMADDWLDRSEGTITIPRHQECDRGSDGGICGSCRQSAKQLVDVHGISLDEAESYMWGPKTESGAREIAYDATPRTQIAVEDYFDRFDEFQGSQTAINRRVEKIAEATGALDADELYPHALRATAASNLLANGLGLMPLKVHMGWATLDTVLTYADEDHAGTANSVRKALR